MSEDVARLLEIIQEAKEIVMRVEEQLEKIQCEQKLRKYDNILIGATDLLKVRNFGKGMLDALQDALRLEGVVWK